MEGIKIVYGEITKRISEEIHSYKELIEIIPQLFPEIIKEELKNYCIKHANDEQRVIDNNDEFINAIKETQNKGQMTLRLIIIKIKNDSYCKDLKITNTMLLISSNGQKDIIISEMPQLQPCDNSNNNTTTNDKVISKKANENTEAYDEILNKMTQLLDERLSHTESKFDKLLKENCEKMNSTQYMNSSNSKKTPTSMSSLNNVPNIINQVYTNEKCSICKEPLFSIKYFCAICDDKIICEACQHNHTIHPLIKIVLTKENKNFSSRSELMDYIIAHNAPKDNGLIQTNKVMKHLDNNEKLNIDSSSCNNGKIANDFLSKNNNDLIESLILKSKYNCSFDISYDKIAEITLVLINQTGLDINNLIDFNIKKSTQMLFEIPRKISELKDGQVIEFKLIINPYMQIQNDTIEINAYVKGTNIKSESLFLLIHTKNFSSEESHDNNYLKDYVNIASISQQDKLTMYRLYKNKPEDYEILINQILSKYHKI